VEEMTADGIPPDEFAYTALINGYKRARPVSCVPQPRITHSCMLLQCSACTECCAAASGGRSSVCACCHHHVKPLRYMTRMLLADLASLSISSGAGGCGGAGGRLAAVLH
jgi:hypothetical protein